MPELTDSSDRTRGLRWGAGIEHRVDPWHGVLCEVGVIHLYDDPLVVVQVDPIHWEVQP